MAKNETTAKFNADISELQKAFQDAKRVIKQANAEFKNSTSGLDNWQKSATGLEAKLKQLYTTRDAEKQQLKNLRSQYEKAVEILGENSKEAQDLNIKIIEQEAKIGKTNTQIKKYTASLKEMASSTDEVEKNTSKMESIIEKVASGIKKTGTSVKEFISNGVDKLVSGLKSAGEQAKNSANGGFTVLKGVLVDLTSNAIQKATDSIVGFAKQSAETGKNFSSAMSQVSATMAITKDTIEEDGTKPYEKLEAIAEQCGATTKYSATQSAEALNYLALAGYDVDKAVNSLPGTLDIASAGGMELADTVDMVTDAMSALGIEATSDNLTTFGDQLAKTSQKSNTSMSQLGEAILTVGGTAKNLAGGTTEMNTALGILADAGTKGADGGTALRNVILSLGTPTDVAKKKLDELGVQVYDANGNMRPLNETFKDLNNVMKDMTNEQKNDVINTIFNKTDIKSVNDLLSNCGDRWNELSKQIEQSDGACKQMAETMNDNLEGDLASLNSAIEGVQITLSKQMEPAMRNTIQSFTNLVSKIDWESLFNKIFQFKDNIVNTLTSYVVPALDNLKDNISSVVDNIKDKIPLIKKKVQETIPSVIDKLNELKDRFIVVKNNIVQAISTYILPVFSQLKQTGKQIFESLKNAIKGTSEPLISFKDVLSTAINVILPITRDIIIGLVDVIGNFITLIIDNKEVVSAIIIGIGTAFLTWNVITMIQGLGTAISTLPAILSAVKVAMAGLNATISANPVGIIIALIAGVIAYLVHLYNTSDEFRMLVDTIWQKIKEFWSEFSKNWAIGVDMIVEFFTKTIPDAWNKFKDDWATGMAIIVEWITIKVPQFFKDCWQSIKDTFSNVGNWFKDTFKTAWENVKNVFASWGEFFSDLWDRIKDTFINLGTELGDAIGGTVKSAINGVIDGIESTINSGVDLINGAIDLINNIPGISIGYMGGLNLPRLAKGGIVNNPILAQIGEQGKEAVVPLENNLGWIKNLANQLAIKINQGTGFNNSTSSNVTNNFYQTNNSPKALSRLEIYRQSKNLLSLKGA